MAYSDVVIADGASGYWPLQETSGTTAVALAGGVNGTISGGVTLGVPGPAGGTAMRFDGVNGVITMPKGTYSDFGTGPITVELWVRYSSVPTGSARMVDCRQGANAGLDVVQDATNTTFGLFRNAAGTQLAVSAANVLQADGQWRHLVIVLTRGAPDVMVMFVNGVQRQSTNAAASGLNYTTTQVLTLARNAAGTAPFAGDFAQVAVYQVALTPAQIAAHYELGTTGAISYRTRILLDGASGYWPLQETSGTTAGDAAGGVNGTISGGVTLGVPGPAGGTAMQFDGATGRVLVPTGAYQTFGTGPFSIECWIKIPAPLANKWFLAFKLTPNTSPGIALLVSTSGADRLQVKLCTAAGTQAFVDGPAGSLLPDGQWRHLVAVVSRGPDQLRLYQNGTQIGATASIGTAGLDYSATAGTGIGAAPENIVHTACAMAHVAVYQVALTPTQITAHYQAGLAAISNAVALALSVFGGDMPPYNIWSPITPSDSLDLQRPTDGVFVGGAGTLAAVMQNNQMPVALTVPAGAWLPIAVKRVNATGTTATGVVALYET